ncbi:GIY-YIG nuclease family protein [Ectobacillus polymachus]|uniref:GIY-YIG nuclease family protein n=1 Tax=Ectobacillus polymachus TaxID=1508806 RepID=UPI003A875D0C
MDFINQIRLNTNVVAKTMFGTVIQDAYKMKDTKDIVNALDHVCNPNDGYGWASSGVYCFWDYETKEVLYIGLAVDLGERFKQHNGILPMKKESCKFVNIKSYFNQKEKLGYSILTMSPISQPVIKKNVHKIYDEEVELSDFANEHFKRDLKIVEGILIEAYRIKNGSLPPWNKRSGSLVGKSRSTEGNYDIVRSFTNKQESALVANCTIRELKANPMSIHFEEFLHVVRDRMLTYGISFSDALKESELYDKFLYDLIMKENYLSKKKKWH